MMAAVLKVDRDWLAGDENPPVRSAPDGGPHQRALDISYELLSLARQHGWSLNLDLQMGSASKTVLANNPDALVSVDEWREEQLRRAGGGEPIEDYAARRERDAAAKDLERELEAEAQRVEEQRAAADEERHKQRRRDQAS